MEKITLTKLCEMKKRGEKIAMLTAYDFCSAKILDEAGVEVVLVGDSLGMVMLGYENTLPVTMEEMLHHTRCVARAAKRALIVGDMPFMSYQVSVEEAVKNAGRFVKEGGAHAVKLEGGGDFAPAIKAILRSGVPVMGHLGLTPQSIHQIGGYKVQGKDESAALLMIEDAKLLEKTGIFCLILECVPEALAKAISQSLHIPVIGIGAGRFCDGQVLVFHDMMGLYQEFIPRHIKRYANLTPIIRQGIMDYCLDVKEGRFPQECHTNQIKPEIMEKVLEGVKAK